ncbi:MAG: cytochrome c [Deltaproteobacteria bacterium]|nr:cytochrome c [Deltaproteobacteria bacterium]
MTSTLSNFAIIVLVACAAAGCSKTTATAGTGEGAGAAAAANAAPSLHDMGEPGDAAKGKATYEKVCTPCHQADGSGSGGMLAANFKTDKSRLAKPDSALFKSIKDGVQGKIGVMPAQAGSLSDQEIKDVLAYVRATFGG